MIHPAEVQRRIYALMVLMKAADDRLSKGIATGEFMCVYWPSRGQEAIAAAMGVSLRDDDQLVTTYRGLHDLIGKGVPLEEARTEIWFKTLHSAGWPELPTPDDEIPPPFDSAAMVHHRLYSAMQAEAKFVLSVHAGLFVREHVSQSFLALPPPAEALHLIGANLGEKGTRTVLSQQGLWAAIRYYFENRTDAMVMYALLALATLALYALAVRGLWRLVRQIRNRNKPAVSAVTVLLVFFTIAHFFAGGIATVPRYFLPLLPLIAVLAAIGALKTASKGAEKN